MRLVPVQDEEDCPEESFQRLFGKDVGNGADVLPIYQSPLSLNTGPLRRMPYSFRSCFLHCVVRLLCNKTLNKSPPHAGALENPRYPPSQKRQHLVVTMHGYIASVTVLSKTIRLGRACMRSAAILPNRAVVPALDPAGRLVLARPCYAERC